MCQGRPTGTPQNLHEKVCHATAGIPCRAAHGLGRLLALILGRTPAPSTCCSSTPESTSGSCGCGGHPPQA